MAEKIEGFIDMRATQTLPAAVASAPRPDSHLAEHLVGLADGQWALWHWAGLRGAGFPATLPLKLAAVACAARADQLIAAEQQCEAARANALAVLRRTLASVEETERALVEKAVGRLRKNKLADLAHVEGAAAEALANFRGARAQIEAARSAFLDSYRAALEQSSAALRTVASDNLFCAALIWQNRRAFHTAVKPLLHKPVHADTRSSKQRQHEELVASYLQRYCLKNDTIGFFGPVGWAKLMPTGLALTCRPGRRLVAARHVYFESWCIEALTKTLAANPDLQLWAAPRRSPLVHAEGALVFPPFRPPIKLSDKQSLVLASCDGARPAPQLAAQLRHAQPQLFTSDAEIYTILAGLRAQGVIAWALEIPVATHSERLLRAQLERVEPEELRRRALSPLDELEATRAAVVAAAGEAEKLDAALGTLEATFTRLTNVAATRNEGQMYAGRTPVYEDCRRDAEVAVGPELIESLGAPLSLLLTSARWFTYQLAVHYRQAFKRIYAELAARLRTPSVDGLSFMMQARTLLLGDQSSLGGAVLAEFQRRWADILAVPTGARHAYYESEQLRARVCAAFAAPCAGWSFARYQSPDIMISATGAAAVRRGDYQLVLGELHIGANTLRPAFFLEHHPAPDEILRALNRDLPQPRLEPIWAHSIEKITSRGVVGLINAKDFRLALAPDAFGAPPDKTVPIAALVVEQQGEELILRTRDGRLRYELIEGMGDLMSARAANQFKLFAPLEHTPRVSFDRLIVARETWRCPAAELRFAFEKEDAARFLGARRWRQQHQLPRFVFVKSPVETKPFYVDFSSPIYLDILAKVIRRTARSAQADTSVVVSEMLPTAAQTWLPDSAGRHYTSELRLVALDPKTTHA